MVIGATVGAVGGVLAIVFRHPVDRVMRRVAGWTLSKDSDFVKTARPGAVMVGGIGWILVAIILFVRAVG